MQVIKDALSLRARNDSASPLIAPKFMVRPCTELNLIVTNEQEQSLQNTATLLRSAFPTPQQYDTEFSLLWFNKNVHQDTKVNTYEQKYRKKDAHRTIRFEF